MVRFFEFQYRSKRNRARGAPARDEVVAPIKTAESFDAELLAAIDRVKNEMIELF